MNEIEYTLKRSSRKTIAIYVLPDGSVEVRAPLKAPMSDIERFVAEKAEWIRSKSAGRAERAEQRENFSLNYGDTVLYRGKECPIMPCGGNKAYYEDGHFYIPSEYEADFIYVITQLYRILAKNHITERVLYYAGIMGCSVTAVKINSAKGRWGSCSGRNSLNFSWRTVLASDDAIDYIVVHELAHTKEHNHSDRFWKIVADVLPDYKRRQDEYEALAAKLSRENWD